MSSDLLAEFDTFYRAPQDTHQNATPALNDLSFLNGTNTNGMGQAAHARNAQQWQSQRTQPTDDVWGSMASFQNSTQAPIASQNDIWGSFGAATDISQRQTRLPATSTSIYTRSSAGSQESPAQSQPTVVRRPTLDLFSGNVDTFGNSVSAKGSATSARLSPQRPAPQTKISYGEVLFDADEALGDAEDDDFGDFESVAPEPFSHTKQPQSLNSTLGAMRLESKLPKRPANLLSTTDGMTGMLPYPQAPKSPSFKERNPYADLGLATKVVSNVQREDQTSQASPMTAWPTYKPQISKPASFADSPAPNNPIDDDWGDFEDLPSEKPVRQVAKRPTGIAADAWAWDSADQVTESASAQEEAPPPTNIPPPSTLLALFPPIFDLPQSALFKPVANQPFSLKNRIISDPSAIEFLRAYLLIATVAARIVAGRKLRWKRDTLLSQAMKIGQAAAGGKGGMKLAGVDKAETTREDRETAEVVRVWKEQLGRLRSAVAVANSSMHDVSRHLSIPDVSEAMHIKIQERALNAPRQCLICGLKREERVNKVDVDVEDSFGEWWVDHWGHRACRNFWLEHEAKLKFR